MKHLFVICLLTCFAFVGHSQKPPKNELSFGYFSAGEFFDETPMKFSTHGNGRCISINYTRLLEKNLSVGLTYARSGFQYIPVEIERSLLDDNSVDFRSQRVFTANMGVSVSKWSLVLRGKMGVRYNQRSLKSVHLWGGWHANGWYESRGLVDRYGRLGASMGVSIAHPIFWRIFGEFDSEFAKMFTRADRNQLLLSYRIGFRF